MFTKRSNDKDKKDQKLTYTIEDLENKICELEEDRDYWHDCYSQMYEKKEQLEDKISTMKDIMENLAPHQIPTHELPLEYFDVLIYGNATAFTSGKRLPYQKGDYIIIKGVNDAIERTKVVRINKIEDFSFDYNFGYPKYEALGFESRSLCLRDLKFTYPEKTDKDIIYIYFVDVLA